MKIILFFVCISIFFQYFSTFKMNLLHIKYKKFEEIIQQDLFKTNEELLEEMNSDVILESFDSVIVAPITEEIIFRYGFYQFLKYIVNPVESLIISSIFFSFVHSMNHIVSYNETNDKFDAILYINHLLMTFFGGIAFGLTFEKYGLYGAILLHAFVNSVATFYFLTKKEEVELFRKQFFENKSYQE